MATYFHDLISTQKAGGNLVDPLFMSGQVTRKVIAKIEKVATNHTTGTVLVIADELPPTTVVTSAKISNDALTGISVVFGIYTAGGVTVKDADAYRTTYDISAGVSDGNLISSLDIANRHKSIGELAGDTSGGYAVGGYALALTLTAASGGAAATGTIFVELELSERQL